MSGSTLWVAVIALLAVEGFADDDRPPCSEWHEEIVVDRASRRWSSEAEKALEAVMREPDDKWERRGVPSSSTMN